MRTSALSMTDARGAPHVVPLEVSPERIRNESLSFSGDTPRHERDSFRILSGLTSKGTTCGAPLAAVIENADVRTGDMISSWRDGAAQHGVQIERIVGIDPSEGMLEVARQKFPSCEFIKATAGATTLDDASMDILSISYGIRNVVELDAALAEFNRVVKPGGSLVVLEFTKAASGGLAFKIRDFYVSKIFLYLSFYKKMLYFLMTKSI